MEVSVHCIVQAECNSVSSVHSWHLPEHVTYELFWSWNVLQLLQVLIAHVEEVKGFCIGACEYTELFALLGAVIVTNFVELTSSDLFVQILRWCFSLCYYLLSCYSLHWQQNASCEKQSVLKLFFSVLFSYFYLFSCICNLLSVVSGFLCWVFSVVSCLLEGHIWVEICKFKCYDKEVVHAIC
jgi:hypothetical protein